VSRSAVDADDYADGPPGCPSPLEWTIILACGTLAGIQAGVFLLAALGKLG
jgi:hypothetical protein